MGSAMVAFVRWRLVMTFESCVSRLNAPLIGFVFAFTLMATTVHAAETLAR